MWQIKSYVDVLQEDWLSPALCPGNLEETKEYICTPPELFSNTSGFDILLCCVQRISSDGQGAA